MAFQYVQELIANGFSAAATRALGILFMYTQYLGSRQSCITTGFEIAVATNVNNVYIQPDRHAHVLQSMVCAHDVNQRGLVRVQSCTHRADAADGGSR